jgi:hypothetical protein
LVIIAAIFRTAVVPDASAALMLARAAGAPLPLLAFLNRPLERLDESDQIREKRLRHRVRKELVNFLGITREQASGREKP